MQDQKPSPKYVEQARKFAGDAAASKIADAPRINKEGGGVGRADFAPSQQPGVQAAGKAGLAPKDIRGGAHTTPLASDPESPPIIQNAGCLDSLLQQPIVHL